MIIWQIAIHAVLQRILLLYFGVIMFIYRSLVRNKSAVYLRQSTSHNFELGHWLWNISLWQESLWAKGNEFKTAICTHSGKAKQETSSRDGNVALNLLMFGLSLALSKSLLCTQHKYGVLCERYGLTKIKLNFQRRVHMYKCYITQYSCNLSFSQNLKRH